MTEKNRSEDENKQQNQQVYNSECKLMNAESRHKAMEYDMEHILLRLDDKELNIEVIYVSYYHIIF